MTIGAAASAEFGGARRLSGAVVMLDALGMRGIWTRREPSAIVDAWLGLVARLEQSTATLAAANPTVCGGHRIAAFSDTVILTLESKAGAENLGRLIQIAGDARLEPFLIGLFEGILLRGVATAGDYYQTQPPDPGKHNSLLTIGPAIDEAAEWYDQSDWIGISTVPSASFRLDEARELGQPRSEALVPCAIPLKTGSTMNGWALDWPAGVLANRGAAARAAVLSVFAANPIPPHALSKYRHSLAFFDSRLEELLATAGTDASA